jgi:hypothetical protein|tara:strand:- start:171 stop:524 length:354 start_codon:yes stop_codon:yes gene_type:complete
MKVPKKYKQEIKNKIKKKKKKEEKERLEAPPLSKRLKNFTISAIKHVAKGMPTCTQEEIDERLEICRGCKWFRGGSCRKCGCACNNNKKFLNKLAWADQECPIGKWGKIEEDEQESE